MEANVEKLFSKEILQEAALRFGAGTENIKKLGDFENYVFEVEKDGVLMILRLTHSSHRSYKDVLAELEWVNYLSHKGVNVAGPYLSLEGNLVEIISVSDSFFYVSSFTKAEGSNISVNDSKFAEPLFISWGETIGAMNRYSKLYKVNDGNIKRPQWYEEELLEIEKYLPNNDVAINRVTKELIEELYSLPVDNDSFGLIHSDVHSGNFFYDGKKICVFDFDDSSYHWFISDIAIPLYYAVWRKSSDLSEKELKIFATNFFKAFWKGYKRENELSIAWLERMPLFLRLRDITLYTVFHKKMPRADLEGKFKDTLLAMKNRIINKEPIIDLDYKEIIKDL